MEQEIKYLADPQSGFGNFDDADFVLGTNEVVNMENMRTGSTDSGIVGTVESIGSTLMLSPAEPSITNISIGSADDTANNRILYFLKDIYGVYDKIACYDIESGNTYNVLLHTQVTDGLNFDKDHPIHSARVINGLLYWCEDSINEPRRVDINAGINLNHPNTYPNTEAYTAPVEASVIRLIRRQPGLPVTATKGSDSFVNNFIKNEAFRFAYFYDYKNYELSTLSGQSKLINYNTSIDTFNKITITVPFGEKVTQDARIVNLVAYYLNSNTYFIIKSWDKNIPSELAEIQAHNNGITALTFAFYNDFTGISIANSVAEKLFDSVPIYSETLENAQNRLFLSNNVSGYDTPTVTSLAASTFISNAVSQTGEWIKIEYNSGASVHYFLDLGSLGFFDATIQPSPLPYPTTYAYGNLVLVATGSFNFATYITANYSGWINGIQYSGSIATITGAPAVPGLSSTVAFKSGASYQVAIEFLDHSGRKSGILGGSDLKLNIAEKVYSQTDYTTAINWSLSNSAAVSEIPDWAYYYSVNISKCLTTRFFLDARVKNITYATKDANGVYLFNTSVYISTLNGVALDITLLNGYGMGYLFTEGDLVKVYIGSIVYNLSIIAQQGNWIICGLQNLGTLGTTSVPKTDALFEIYTPYKPLSSEPSFEVAQIYTITNPTKLNRTYSTLAGSMTGDVTLLTRSDGTNNYLTENMSPNDKFYASWNTDCGRPNFVDTIGQVTKKNNITYSETFVQGTKINGLSTFDYLNTKDVPSECGAVKKLQVTSKVNDEQGIVMLAICEDETASLYLGETQQYGSNQQTTLTLSTQIIGTINILKGSYGTLNPESVLEFRGNVFWIDISNGKIIQYSSSGLFPISDYKMTRFWNLFCKQYNAMTKAQIEALGSRPFIFISVDPHHLELIISVPKLLSTPPKGYLPDYPSTTYPFDIWDGQAKALVFKFNGQSGFWRGSFNYPTEGFISMQNSLYSFKYGRLWKHNQTSSYNNIYGVQYKSRAMCIFNQMPAIPKSYNNISLKCNIAPTFSYFYSEKPYQQASDLVDFEWVSLEGNLYTTIKRNKLIPTASGYTTNGLMTAETMRTAALRVMLEFTVSSTPIELEFVDIGYTVSLGHNFKNMK
jgi:hypothetical protein